MIERPYLLFLGDAPDALAAKVAQGIRDWRSDTVVGQFRMEGCQADMKVPDLTIEEAAAKGARTLIVGVANRGGVISQAWTEVLVSALAAGFDIASGLHNRLADVPELAEAAAKHGRTLHDVRVPQGPFPIANGKRRTGKRCLAVGTDCSIGKMYTALAMERVMAARSMPATFRATGQTGILVTGAGIPLDAIVADFMAGAVEQLTPDNDPEHWDLIEGQGSLFHASYSGVTLALIHGGQPDALVLCHEPTRGHMRGLPDYRLPSLDALRDLSLQMARIVNPAAEVVGIAVNTSALHEEAALEYLEATEARLGLPTVDPYRQGADRLVDALAAL
ncbi:MAG: N-acetyltransferase DgcN [Pseudomonadota bacterium]